MWDNIGSLVSRRGRPYPVSLYPAHTLSFSLLHFTLWKQLLFLIRLYSDRELHIITSIHLVGLKINIYESLQRGTLKAQRKNMVLETSPTAWLGFAVDSKISFSRPVVQTDIKTFRHFRFIQINYEYTNNRSVLLI